ncbi:hypothetical protein OCH239_14255 [Roseivivax halodurans JCM 10272]|uniref:Inner membrane protein n=1 Tax=Roseivivax halodurans JCM 10272 TaxID=1449350 RepID=X7EIG9_9RHOB|nr:YgjV family protein [Roseivivax halodurans]ETX15695.1 hypothetical protein OCH239_14255 [Roseivivax halodurans JCM 10272]
MSTLAALLGSLALLSGVTSYALPDDVLLRRLNLLCCGAWAGHFLALGDAAGASMLVIAMVMIGARMLGLSRLGRAAWLVNVTVAAAALVSVAMGQTDGRALLPILGAFFINTGVCYCTRHMLTGLVVIGEVLWLAHAWSIGSVFAVVSTGLALGALAVRSFGVQTRVAAR